MGNMLYRLIVLWFLFVTVSASGQENLLYKKVQEEKSSGSGFKVIPKTFTQGTRDRNALDHYIDPDQVHFLRYDQAVLQDLSTTVSLVIPLRDKEMNLELIEVSADFYGYEVVTNEGERHAANVNNRHYRGIVKDDPNSIAAVSFLEGEVMGLVATDEGNFNLSLTKIQVSMYFTMIKT